jgi:hypothetical protein
MGSIVFAPVIPKGLEDSLLREKDPNSTCFVIFILQMVKGEDLVLTQCDKRLIIIMG